MEPDQTALLMAFGSEVSIRIEYFSEVMVGNGRGCGTIPLPFPGVSKEEVCG